MDQNETLSAVSFAPAFDSCRTGSMSACIKRLPGTVAGANTAAILGEPVEHGQRFRSSKSSPSTTMPTRSVSHVSGAHFWFFAIFLDFFRICQNHATMLVNTRTSTFPLGAHFFHEARTHVVEARARLNRAASRSSSSTSVVQSVPKTAFNNPDRASVAPRASAVRCSPSTVHR